MTAGALLAYLMSASAHKKRMAMNDARRKGMGKDQKVSEKGQSRHQEQTSTLTEKNMARRERSYARRARQDVFTGARMDNVSPLLGKGLSRVSPLNHLSHMDEVQREPKSAPDVGPRHSTSQGISEASGMQHQGKPTTSVAALEIE
eukprot:jgi/Chrzof1/6403/Cz18g09110.t1